MKTDHRLKKDVTEELSWEPSIQADHIGVAAETGIVTLTGHVPNFWQKAAAERAVSRVKGVRAIVEDLDVRLSGDIPYHDDEIAAAILHRLAWHPSIPTDAVIVKVEDGIVTLTGEVDWSYQHDLIKSATRTIAGVVAVFNNVSVKARRKPDAGKIQKDIKRALNRYWLSGDDFHVTTTGGDVRLTGNVASYRDRDLAGRTAWRAQGTTSVVNDLHIA